MVTLALVTLAEVLAVVVPIVVMAFFLHLAAGFMSDHPPFVRSLLVALLGGVVAGLLVLALDDPWGVILAAVAWVAVAATIYRIGIFRAFLLGLFAYLLFILVRWLILLAAGAAGIS